MALQIVSPLRASRSPKLRPAAAAVLVACFVSWWAARGHGLTPEPWKEVTSHLHAVAAAADVILVDSGCRIIARYAGVPPAEDDATCSGPMGLREIDEQLVADPAAALPHDASPSQRVFVVVHENLIGNPSRREHLARVKAALAAHDYGERRHQVLGRISISEYTKL
jgi:hypothetical protein